MKVGVQGRREAGVSGGDRWRVLSTERAPAGANSCHLVVSWGKEDPRLRRWQMWYRKALQRLRLLGPLGQGLCAAGGRGLSCNARRGNVPGLGAWAGGGPAWRRWVTACRLAGAAQALGAAASGVGRAAGLCLAFIHLVEEAGYLNSKCHEK